MGNVLSVFRGPARNWISRDGRPARCVGLRGMPSFESDDGFLVMGLLIVLESINDHGFVNATFYPRDYGPIAALYPEGLVAAHYSHEEKSLGYISPDGDVDEIPLDLPPPRKYRPSLYYITSEGLHRMGSQAELAYRYAVNCQWVPGDGHWDETSDEEVTAHCQAQADAEFKAREWLKQFLTPYQLLELAISGGSFHVRGEMNLYRITLDNGFDIVDKRTHQTIAGYCLHTEHWLPGGDQALALLLKLRSPEGEQEVLDNANLGHLHKLKRPTWEQCKAAELEKELI